MLCPFLKVHLRALTHLIPQTFQSGWRVCSHCGRVENSEPPASKHGTFHPTEDAQRVFTERGRVSKVRDPSLFARNL